MLEAALQVLMGHHSSDSKTV